MKKLLIISFDLIREGENEKSLAISSILSFLKKDKRYGEDFLVYHLPINMFKFDKNIAVNDLKPYLEIFNFHDLDFVALSAYIWNEYLTNDLMQMLRKDFGFLGNYILGGYQISYSNNPELEYPEARYFINGYAEQGLLKLLTEEVSGYRINSFVDFTQLPSPYLTKELEITDFQKMVRMETKRGCPYKCTFCAHRDLTYNKVYKHQLDKVFSEISFFKEKQVNKINIIDPIFNAGNYYLNVLNEFVETKNSSLISVQARFETIHGENGKKFLDYCSQLNVNLEFGLQSANREESQLINRKNNPQKIKAIMQELNERKINYEISLIYGLPNQTLDSFKESVEFVFENGCTNITAFPLMLLKGTELYQQKKQFGFKEQKLGAYNIPVVTQSNSFSEKEWYQMKAIASNLTPNNRI
ncbi:MAG: radical SAM protein [Bacteroidota bacterium]